MSICPYNEPVLHAFNTTYTIILASTVFLCGLLITKTLHNSYCPIRLFANTSIQSAIATQKADSLKIKTHATLPTTTTGGQRIIVFR